MLEITHLKKSFGTQEVLKDVTCTLQKGKIYVLLGENGAGKTTLINCILKMLKTDAGEIKFKGKTISQIHAKEYYQLIGALLESSSNVYQNLSTYENLHYFAGLHKVNLKKDTRWESYVEELELKNHMHKKAGNFSRGMQQKLALLISLLGNPELLLLDEPTLGLDFSSKNRIIDTLRRLAVEEGKCILLSSHQIDVIEKLGGEVLLLNKGELTKLDLSKQLQGMPSHYHIKYIKNDTIEEADEIGKITDFLPRHENYEILEIIQKDSDLESVILEYYKDKQEVV